MEPTRRVIHPAVKVIDSARGIVDYVASDESLDSYREVIRASGWRFNMFRKNAPFVDSHEYWSIEKQLGKVIDFRVEKQQLIERVQWAIDVPENKLAQLGWKMTEAGYLKAVSVGFWPVKTLTKWDKNPVDFQQHIEALNLPADVVRTIYIEQEQLELSACIIGANPNALAKSYKAGVIDDGELEFAAELEARNASPRTAEPQESTERETASAAASPDDAAQARHRAREEFLRQFEMKLKTER